MSDWDDDFEADFAPNDGDDDQGNPTPQFDPAQAALNEQAEIEKMKKRLHRQMGFSEDELDTMYPTYAKLKAFYKEVVKVSKMDSGTDAVDDEDKWEESKATLTLDEQADAEFVKEQLNRGRKSKIKKSAFAAVAKAKKQIEEDQSHLKEEDRVSTNEIQDALADLAEVDEDEDSPDE